MYNYITLLDNEQPFMLTEMNEDDGEDPLKTIIRQYDDLLFDYDYPVIGTVDFLGESIPYTKTSYLVSISTRLYTITRCGN